MVGIFIRANALAWNRMRRIGLLDLDSTDAASPITPPPVRPGRQGSFSASFSRSFSGISS